MARSFGSRKSRSNDDDDSALLKGIEYIESQSDDEIPLAQLDEFIIPGADQKGRKVTITFNIPPALDRQIDIILASRRFPYANKKDLIRHGITRHVGWLVGEIRKTIPRHFLTFFDATSELVRDDEALMKMEQIFQQLSSRIHEHMSRGEHQEVMRLVGHIDQSVQQMPQSLWVRRFKERFYSNYGSVLKGTYQPPQLESGDEQ